MEFGLKKGTYESVIVPPQVVAPPTASNPDDLASFLAEFGAGEGDAVEVGGPAMGTRESFYEEEFEEVWGK